MSDPRDLPPVPVPGGYGYLGSVDVSLDDMVARLKENLTFAQMTQRAAVEQQDHLAEHLLPQIEDAMGHLDPQVMLEAALRLGGILGGFLALGYPPAMALNVVSLAAAKRAGIVPRTGIDPPP